MVCEADHRDVVGLRDVSAVRDDGRRPGAASVYVESNATRAGNGRAGAEDKRTCGSVQDVNGRITTMQRGRAVEVVGAVGIVELQACAVGRVQRAGIESYRAGVVAVGNTDQRSVVSLSDVAAVSNRSGAAVHQKGCTTGAAQCAVAAKGGCTCNTRQAYAVRAAG